MNLSRLSNLLVEYFSRDEFRVLFMDLGLEYENAPNESRIVLSDYLIRTYRDKGKLDELLQVCQEKREHVDWPTLAELTVTQNDDLLAHPHLPVYKKWVVQQYNVLRLLSMERPLPLDAVYTDVYLLNKNQYWQGWDGDQTRARLEAFSQRELGDQDERHSGVEMLEKEKHLFIVGQPGAGKTTFLWWLAVRSAQNELSLNKIPILVELRRLNDGQYSLFELIVKEWLDSGFPKGLAEEYAEQLIRSGNALVLLDGLDEVRQELRERINNQIDRLVKKSSDSHVVITCRPHAKTRQFKTFTYMEMAEFAPEQTKQFIKNWFGSEEVKANKLIQELENREQKPIQELTKTPLLLALICITFDQVDDLPQKRADLYKHALDVVLSEWDDERGIRRESIYGQLTTKRKEALLSYVAYHSFEAGQLFISQKELKKLITDFWQDWRQTEIARQKEEYGQVFRQELPEREVNAAKILAEIIAQHGIFVEQAKDICSFAHLSFQEYFTARYIANHARQGTLKRLLVYASDDKWREVYLLTTSLLDVEDVEEFITLFIQCLNNMSQNSVLLLQVLTWARTKALMAIYTKQLAYKPTALRAWFLALNPATINAFDRGFGDLDRALAQSRTFFRWLTFNSARSLANKCARDLDHNFDNAVFCDHALHLAHDIAHDLSIDRIDHAYGRALALTRALHRVLEPKYVYLALGNLVIPKLEDNDEVWQLFVHSLLAIIQQYRELSGLTYLQEFANEDKQAIEAMDWSKEGVEQYVAYLKATQLLVDCLPLAMVSDRAAIEDQLLLPDLNEDEKLEKK